MNLFTNIILPLLMGALVPLAFLIYCFVFKERSKLSVTSLFYGFGSFFGAIGAIFILFLFITNVMAISISVSAESDVNSYLYIGGGVLLLIFYLITEALRFIFYKIALKSDRSSCAGCFFGIGFAFAQNIVFLILCTVSNLDDNAALYFGIMMLISSLIYILISILSYNMICDGQKLTGSALAILYYLMYGIMLIVANVVVTYIMFAVVLAFVLLLAYLMLPLPFKKEAN